MWVYTGNSLERRLLMGRRVGCFLDYWLLIHAEDAHPFMSARPLSLQSIVRAILDSTSDHDRSLRTQLKRELRAVVSLAALLPHLPTSPSVLPKADQSPWSTDWLSWCSKVDPLLESRYTVPPISDSLAAAISSGNAAEIGYFSRRLACELSGADQVPSRLFTAVKGAFCDSGTFDDGRADVTRLQDVLHDLFRPRPTLSYRVHFRLAQAAVSRSVLRQIKQGPQAVVEVDPGGRELLSGAVCEVLSSDPQNAVRSALGRLQPFLDQLRLRFYVRTHVCSAAKVVDAADETETWISLPQPFWTKKGDRRGTPRVPPRFQNFVTTLSPEEQARWNAARWHLSQAFADWPEDSHSAASHCWLAIEGFAAPPGKALPRVQRLAGPYLVVAVRAFSEYLSGRIAAQSHALYEAGKAPDWYYRLAHRTSTLRWMNRVLDERSLTHYSRWRSPEAPWALFDPAVGVLQVLRRRMTVPGVEQWMDMRIRSDLSLLYGLRNKAVHSGTRVFGSSTAAYLGRVASEVVLTLMSERSARSAVALGVKTGHVAEADPEMKEQVSQDEC